MFSKARMADLNELIPTDSGRTLVAVDGITKVLDCSRMTGNPHLACRWPFGRVTEGLPTIQPEPHFDLQPVWMSASPLAPVSVN